MEKETIKNIISSNFDTIDEDESLSQAMGKFKTKDALIVLNQDGKYSGIITERQIARTNLDFSSVKVKRLKIKVPKLSPDTLLPDAADILIKNDIKNLPVFENNRIIGILDDEAILKQAIQKDMGNKKVEEFMTKNPFILNYDTTIKAALHEFRQNNISRAPILKDEKLYGVVTLHDIVTKAGFPKFRQNKGEVAGEKIDILDNSIGGIASSEVLSVRDDKTLKDAIIIMLNEGVSGVLVLDDKKKLKGIITKKDILEPIAALKEKETKNYIQIAGDTKGLDNIDRIEVISKLDKFAIKFSNKYDQGYMVVYLKKQKIKSKKQTEYHSKIRFYCNRGTFIAADIGWGVVKSVSNALENLERQLVKKDTKERSKRIKGR